MHTVAVTSYESGGKYETTIYGRPKSPAGKRVEGFTDKNGRTVWYSPEEQTA